MQTENVASPLYAATQSAGPWDQAAPAAVAGFRQQFCEGELGAPCFYVPSESLTFDSPVAPVVLTINGTETVPSELTYLQVYVLTVTPTKVLPSAPGPDGLTYTFEIIGEGVQDADVVIREIVIGPVSCS